MPAREGQERGRGTPLEDAERVARHWGISLDEAYILLEVYPVNVLIPERGYGLSSAVPKSISGYTMDDFGMSLLTMEDSLPMKGKARIELCTDTLPTDDDLANLYADMTLEGFHMTIPKAKIVWQGGIAVPTTTFTLQKGSPVWPALIAILPTVFIVGLVAYGITRIGEIQKALLPLMLVAFGGTVVIIGLLVRPAERVATKYIESPKKLAYAPSTIPNDRKTEEERKARHEALYPGEPVPERGTGLKKVSSLPQTSELDSRPALSVASVTENRIMLVGTDNGNLISAEITGIKGIPKITLEGALANAVGRIQNPRNTDMLLAAAQRDKVWWLVTKQDGRVTELELSGIRGLGEVQVEDAFANSTAKVSYEPKTQESLAQTADSAYMGGWKPGDKAIYSDFGLRSLYIVEILPWPEHLGERFGSTVEGPLYLPPVMHDRRQGSVRAKIIDTSLAEWDFSWRDRPLPEWHRRGTEHYYHYTNLYRNIVDLIKKEGAVLNPQVHLRLVTKLMNDPAWSILQKYGLIVQGEPQQLLPQLQAAAKTYHPQTELPPEWSFREDEPPVVGEVTVAMMPPTTPGPGYLQTAEKTWKDFYKGNRVQALIDSYNNRVVTRNVTKEAQDRLHETLKTTWQDLVQYQENQAWAFASGLLNKDEAQQLYQIYGGESPMPEKWDKLSLAEKVAATQIAEEIIKMKLKRRFSMQTEPESGTYRAVIYDPKDKVLESKEFAHRPSEAEVYHWAEDMAKKHGAAMKRVVETGPSHYLNYTVINLDPLRMRQYFPQKHYTQTEPVPGSPDEFAEVKRLMDRFQQLRRETRELWIKACKHEGIPPESKFVVFSEDNPFNKEYEGKMDELLTLRRRMMQLAKRDIPESYGMDVPQAGREDVEVFLSLPPYMPAIWVEDKTSGRVIWKLEGKEKVEKFSAPFKNRADLEQGVIDFLVLKEALKPTGKEFVTIAEAGNSGHNVGDVVAIEQYLRENRELRAKGLHPARGWIRSRGTLASDGNGGRAIEWETQNKSLLEPGKFPKRDKALEGLKPYRVAHVHDDGDLTIISGGKLWVVTTDGQVFERVDTESSQPGYLSPEEMPGSWTAEDDWEAYYRALAAKTPEPGWVKAPEAGRDPYSGWEYPKGTWVVRISQDMFQKELPPFLNNVYVLPWSYEEMVELYHGSSLTKEFSPSTIDMLAKVEGDPISKFCCRQCGECAPAELLQEGKFPERMSWLRRHYQAKHPGLWGHALSPAVIPTEQTRRQPKEGDLEWIADSPEFIPQTIDMTGWRAKIDDAFQEAVARTQSK